MNANSPVEIAAALAKLSLGDRPLLMSPDDHPPAHIADSKSRRDSPPSQRGRSGPRSDEGLEQYRLEVGYQHGVKPGNIVGAITNSVGLDGRYIGHIHIETEYSLVDLPEGMPDEVLADLRKVRVCGQALDLTRVEGPRQERMSKPRTYRKDDTHGAAKRRDGKTAKRKKAKPKK